VEVGGVVGDGGGEEDRSPPPFFLVHNDPGRVMLLLNDGTGRQGYDDCSFVSLCRWAAGSGRTLCAKITRNVREGSREVRTARTCDIPGADGRDEDGKVSIPGINGGVIRDVD
jgi:hypothetical protein